MYRLVLDIDETLLNPLEKYATILSERLDSSITVEDIKKSGSLDRLFSELPIYDDFCKIADQLRGSEEFNSDLPIITDSVEYVEKILKLPQFSMECYLTTRPINIVEVTAKNLQSKGFPSARIIARPNDIDRMQTAEWKMCELSNIVNNTNDQIIFIDDNVETFKKMREWNYKNANQRVVLVLYEGPLTRATLLPDISYNDPSNMCYLIDSWQRIFFLCKDLIE